MSSDLDVVFPEDSIEIQGENITIKELTFSQTMKLGAGLSPLISSLSEALSGDSLDGDQAISAFYKHSEISFKMLSLSSGKDIKYFDSLSDTDGYMLLMVFFSVHSNFFSRRLLSAATQTQELKKVAERVGAG